MEAQQKQEAASVCLSFFFACLFVLLFCMFVSEVKDNIFIVSHKKQNKGREKCPLINTKRAKTIIKMKSCRTRQQKIE